MTNNIDEHNAKIAKKATGKRKFHKKSRKGCSTCKKRRVKCDEGRPICGNCERMNIDCHYLISDNLPLNSTPQTNDESSNISPPPIKKKIKVEFENNFNNVNQVDTPVSTPTNTNDNISNDFNKFSLPITPLLQNAILSDQQIHQQNNTLSPISQFLQQLPQSPVNNSAAQIGMQFLNSFPPEMQVKLFQQFQQLPPDKQQELYQSLPMSRPSSENITNNANPNDNKNKNNTTTNNNSNNNNNDSLSDLISNFLPDKSFTKPILTSNTTPTPEELAAQYKQRSQSSQKLPIPLSSEQSNRNGPSLSPDSIRSPLPPMPNNSNSSSNTGSLSDLNMLDLRLMYHYTTKVWPTITDAGISDSKIWSDDIPMLAFKYPFLMHSVLAFSATHLSRNERGLDQCVTCHRAEALRLLREAVLEMSPENTDALVAAALILIMDSLANASLPTSSSIKSLPASAWIFHVKGAATILTAVWPLSEKSRFYKFISVDLGDLGEIGYDLISGELANTSDSNENSRSNSLSRNEKKNNISSSDNTINTVEKIAALAAKPIMKNSKQKFSSIKCFDDTISDMFPVPLNSPYFPTLAYMAKLHNERNKSDFILRIFAFPALLDKRFLGLLINCDLSAMRIMRCYYKLLRNFTEEMKEKVWFLEGVSTVLPADVDQYAGGGGMHMMLDFLGGPSTIDDDGNGENYVAKSAAQSGLLDTNNLPSASMSESLGLDDGLNHDID